MFKKWMPGCMLIGTLLATTTSFAATPVDLNHYPVSYFKKMLSVKNNSSTQPTLKQVAINKDFNQTSHVKYIEMFAGYQVWGGDVIMHIPQGNALASSMNGLIYQDLQKDLSNATNATFTIAQGNKALKQAIELYREKNAADKIAQDGKARLMVYVDEEKKAHWAFYVTFLIKSADTMPEKPTYILDAETFAVYKNWDDIKTLDAVQGGGYGGNFKTGMITYDGNNANRPKLDMLRDATSKICYLQNEEVMVTNASKQDQLIQFACDALDKSHNLVYWDGLKDSANFGFSPGNDALYAGKIIKNMYQEWYKVPVLMDGEKPMLLKMRVHDKSPMGLENAYWDGEAKAMTFGDGLFTFYPLVSLGVGAHEISHGFTEQHSNLVYEGQSGGLNESFSDMAAQAADFYSSGHNTWDIGSDVTKAAGLALRYMDEPTKDCKGKQPGNMCSIDNVKDYKNSLDVHFSSGVFNKAYYLISTAKEWSPKKAFDVMVQANMNYWTASTSFANAACGVIKATQDYKYDVSVIKTAFSQVGIDTAAC